MLKIGKGNVKRMVSGGLKLAVITGAIAFIVFRLKEETNGNDALAYFNTLFARGDNRWMFLVALVMVPINWGLESVKWHRLIMRVQRLSLLTAFQATLAGVTASLFTPNRAGEFAGRMLYVKPENRIKAILASAICSFGQLLITLTIGSVALVAYLDQFSAASVSSELLTIMLFLVATLTILALFFYYRFGAIRKLLEPLSDRWKKLKQSLKLLNLISGNDYTMVLFLSLLRYTTYCMQFFLLLSFYEAGIPGTNALILIPVNFLGITAIPSIALAELGVREAVALGFLNVSGTATLSIVSATLTLWLINVAGPARGGTGFIAKARIFEGND
jgi:hypothetical protein